MKKMTYYNTIDLDNITKEELQKITQKIKLNKCNIDLKVKDSNSKGYHLLLECNRICDICRMVFDDQKRFEMDNNREEKFRNTLFDEKEYVRGNLKTVTNICERCITYGNTVKLEEKILSVDNKYKKLKERKIKLPFLFRKDYLIGYDYYECPICGWFKLVNNTKAKVREK